MPINFQIPLFISIIKTKHYCNLEYLKIKNSKHRERFCFSITLSILLSMPAKVYFPFNLILPSARLDEKTMLSSFAWKLQWLSCTTENSCTCCLLQNNNLHLFTIQDCIYCLQCFVLEGGGVSSFDEWTREMACCIKSGIIHCVMYTVLCILFIGRIRFKVIMNPPLAIETLVSCGS